MIWTKGANQSAKFQNFNYSREISPNLYCDKLLLLKVYKISAKKVERSYVSWQWRMMQRLKRNWLVVLKLTWGIWQILTQALNSLKNLHFNKLLLTKVYNVWAKKKAQRSYLSWHWRTVKTFEKKLTCGLENDTRNFANFHQSTRKFQNWDFDGILLSKVENVWA